MAVLLFLFWIALNGRLTLEVVAIGAVVSAVLTCCARYILLKTPQKKLRLLRTLPGVFFYLCYLIWEVVKANLQVMGVILRPGGKRGKQGKLVWFPLPVKGELTRLTLANSITLTPGTVTVSMGQDVICVYALQEEFAQNLQASGFVTRLKQLEVECHD